MPAVGDDMQHCVVLGGDTGADLVQRSRTLGVGHVGQNVVRNVAQCLAHACDRARAVESSDIAVVRLLIGHNHQGAQVGFADRGKAALG